VGGESKAGARLIEELAEFQAFFEATAQGIVCQDAQGRVTSANPAAQKMLGLSLEQMLGRNWPHPPGRIIRQDGSEFPAGEHPSMFALSKGESVRNATVGLLKTPEETPRWIRLSAVPRFRLEEEKPFLVWTTLDDITELKAAGEALRGSEQRHRLIVENCQQGIVVDREGRPLFVNARAEEITGYTKAELITRQLAGLVHPDDRAVMLENQLGKLEEERLPQTYQVRIVDKRGRIRWMEIKSVVLDWEGQPASLNFLTDVTKRRWTERALRESEQFLQGIFNAVQEGITVLDLQLNIVRVNSWIERRLAHKMPLLGRKCYEAFQGRDSACPWCPALGAISTGKKRERVVSVESADGRKRRIQLSGYPLKDPEGQTIGVVGHVKDVTEHREARQIKARLEEGMKQARKLEAIGRLAGGIAHDFNNILWAITGYTELALDHVPQDGPARQDLFQVLKACRRAKNLIQQILRFARPSEQERRLVRIDLVVEEVLGLLRASLPATVEIGHQLEAGPEVVLADPTQIHQVVMNLCANAACAMRDQNGLLEVKLERVVLDQVLKTHFTDLGPGVYHRLTVSDTGQGMDEETLSRIFEPFYTTKEPGQGTGMGLSVVQAIVKSHGGAIVVRSEPGQGSTFQVYLPVVAGQADDPGVAPAEPTLGQGERILFVDDEEALAEMGRQMLERLGYQVTASASSLEALEIFKARPEEFDLVITDQTMPKLTGTRLAQEAVRIRPGIPIILCTGFSEQVSAEKAQTMGIRRFIMKPLEVREVAEAIRVALASAA